MPVVDGVAYWASITQPNTKFEPKYTINLVVDEDIADTFRSKGYTVMDKEEGPTLQIKRKVNGPNGMVREAPVLMDRSKNLIDCQVGNGSKVRVQYRPWEVNRQGELFKGLELCKVQVVDLIPFGDEDEFDVIEEEDVL